jgi:hypothetical protein
MPFLSHLHWVFSHGGFPGRTAPHNQWQVKQSLARVYPLIAVSLHRSAPLTPADVAIPAAGSGDGLPARLPGR